MSPSKILVSLTIAMPAPDEPLQELQDFAHWMDREHIAYGLVVNPQPSDAVLASLPQNVRIALTEAP